MHQGRDDAAGGAGDEPAEQLSAALADLAEIQRLAGQVMASALWRHSNAQSVAVVEQSAIAARQVQAAYLAAVADMDARAGTLPNAPAGMRRGHSCGTACTGP